MVDPIFFPGGDIGHLAVNGTVNDLCMSGARPKYLSAAFILEEGLPLEDLSRIVQSMKEAAFAAGVRIITGDTKVVNRGKADKLFINTAGIGVIEHDLTISPTSLKPGDSVLVSGPIANHGLAILSQREGLAFESPIKSDTMALNALVADLVAELGPGLHAMRDPTRGGVAAVLQEFAEVAKVGIRLDEGALPLDPAVAGACEILGLDPLHIANEGKLIAVVSPGQVQAALDIMRCHRYGAGAAVIGLVHDQSSGLVTLRTRLGAERIVDMPVGEQLPRIC